MGEYMKIGKYNVNPIILGIVLISSIFGLILVNGDNELGLPSNPFIDYPEEFGIISVIPSTNIAHQGDNVILNVTVYIDEKDFSEFYRIYTITPVGTRASGGLYSNVYDAGEQHFNVNCGVYKYGEYTTYIAKESGGNVEVSEYVGTFIIEDSW